MSVMAVKNGGRLRDRASAGKDLVAPAAAGLKRLAVMHTAGGIYERCGFPAPCAAEITGGSLIGTQAEKLAHALPSACFTETGRHFSPPLERFCLRGCAASLPFPNY